MSLPDTYHDYDERGSAAVRSVLLELGQVLGAYRDKFVIVGGAVPWLLMPEAQPGHIGTLDIDLNLSPGKLGDGEYATMIECLESAGYERNVDSLKPFQLRRWVVQEVGKPIAVNIDLMIPDSVKTAKNRPVLVEGLRVIGATGAEIALDHNQPFSIEGKMPDGRPNKVQLLVASIPAFLVMKGYALVGRDKKKDAYDIYFSIRNYLGGPVVLANDCLALMQNTSAVQGFRHIVDKYRAEDDFGPQTVRQFLSNSDALGEQTAEQIQVDAYHQVASWALALGLIDSNS